MLPSCKEVATQLSDDIDQPLTGLKKWQVKMHLWLCHQCRHYARQIARARKTLGLLKKSKMPAQSQIKVARDNYLHTLKVLNADKNSKKCE